MASRVRKWTVFSQTYGNNSPLFYHITEPDYPHTLDRLGTRMEQPDLPKLTQDFLVQHLGSVRPSNSDIILPADALPRDHPVSVHHSVAATFFAPSDPCGVGGMHREFVRATPSWWGGPPRYDCVLIATGDPHGCGINGFEIARVRLLFSFKHNGILYPCALVHWFARRTDQPDETTGLWVVSPQYFTDGRPFMEVIHVDTFHRAAHLIAVYDDDELIAEELTFDEALDSFAEFYVNKYADGHMFEALHDLVAVPDTTP